MRDPILTVNFFRTEAGNEPVRAFLKDLTVEDRKTVGEDIKTVQFGWPLGMPLVRKMGKDLWGFVYCQRWPDGVVAWLREEVAEDSAQRTGDG